MFSLLAKLTLSGGWVPRQTAGRNFAHVTTQAKPHNHQMCPVVAAIARTAAAGGEAWGTRHEWTVRTGDIARDTMRGFYAAKRCREIRAEFGEDMSVQSSVEESGQAWKVWVRVWPRSVARAEIARRVRDGEQLHYNVLRGTG
jgi:hypothetical protein